MNAPVGDSLFVRGARLWPSDETVDVRIDDGWVTEVGPALDAGDLTVIEAAGRSVIPGLIDVHVHFRDPGLEHKEGWARGSAGALHGGVTSVVEVQNNPPLSISRQALEERHALVASKSRVDFGLLGNLYPESMEALTAMAPLTPAFKCFLGCSTGSDGMSDPDVVRDPFDGAARAGRMIVAHCEDQNLLDAGGAQYGQGTAATHHLARSTEAEVKSIRECIEHCEATGAELHVFHLSTAEGAELVRGAQAKGLPISASTAPHYIYLSHEDADTLGNHLKVNPSIKTPADSRGIIAALADGTIDAIGTDHAPHALEEKNREYPQAPSGMPSVDILWPLTLELVRRGWLDAESALASVTTRAASTLHLPFKGRLAGGHHGDLVLFDPDAKRKVVGAELPSTSKWSAYEGWELAGFPEIVVRRGQVVFQDGAVTAEAGGRPLDLHAPEPRRS